MRGMSDVDVPNVALALNDGNNGHLIFDVLVQGMMNHIALVQIARGPMATHAVHEDRAAPRSSIRASVYYYGISQGGIMGTTVCAIDPVIKRCVVQVAAINYSLLLERSRDWPTYRTTLIGAYDDPLVVALMINLMQQEWDRTEPTAVGRHDRRRRLPGHAAPSRCSCSSASPTTRSRTSAASTQARTMGLPVITPSPYVPFGAQSDGGSGQSGMVIYDFGLGSTIPRDQRAAARQRRPLEHPQQEGDDGHDEALLRDRRDHQHVHRAEGLRLPVAGGCGSAI